MLITTKTTIIINFITFWAQKNKKKKTKKSNDNKRKNDLL